MATAKKFLLLALSCLLFLPYARADRPDSVYLLGYSSKGAGLYLAWSADGQRWQSIGDNHRFLGCDYGAWGSGKKMHDPWLFQSPDGRWHCVWSVNGSDPCFAHAASDDLVHWRRQAYPFVMEGIGRKGTCLRPTARWNEADGLCTIAWTNGEDGLAYACTTTDFVHFGEAHRCNDLQESDDTPRADKAGQSNLQPASSRQLSADRRLAVEGFGEGTINRIPWTLLEQLENACYRQQALDALHAERCEDDPVRFAQLKPLQATLKINANRQKEISDHLVGVFFEDISYAADGGLYAELVQNRDFEYTWADTKGRNKDWGPLYAWHSEGRFQLETDQPIHPNNPHYLRLEGAGRLVNDGFDGIPLTQGDSYRFSLFSRSREGARLNIRLTGRDGQVLAEGKLSVHSAGWKKQELMLKASATADAVLELSIEGSGTTDLDFISLFPKKTFHNRPNGLRPDLAQAIADLHPHFVRFPGGCVAHGDGLDNMYRWKNTVGPLEARVPQANIWRYHQSAGLGYYEYFQFCEDIHAEPLPVLPAGVPCQNSGHRGQQGGLPLDEMDAYVQEVLDLVEWANGDASTAWGRVRAQAGHPKPFNLKYIGIGNEDLITDVFEERFTMIYRAVKEKYPDLKVVGTVGPFYEGSDYEEGWDLADRLEVDLVDEHYYNPPGWFIYHQDFYDHYDRSKPTKVYLGEYASHLPGRPNNLETALSEALYLTAVERNGDVVEMASYAPLLAKRGHTNWNPDLIYFDNRRVLPTVGYYVQQLYAQYGGDRYLDNHLELDGADAKARARVSASAVLDSRTGQLVLKLVNMLPVGVTTQIDLEGSGPWLPEAQRIDLSGQPADRDLQPRSSSLAVSDDFSLEVPPYSFTLIRLTSKSSERK